MKSKEIPPTPTVILTPTLSQSELFAYFLSKLPPDLSSELFKRGLSCYGIGRLIVTELGGPANARLYQVIFDFADGEPLTSHGYVIPLGQESSRLAYNNYINPILTIAQVLESGKDVTEAIFAEPWSKL